MSDIVWGPRDHSNEVTLDWLISKAPKWIEKTEDYIEGDVYFRLPQSVVEAIIEANDGNA